MLLWNSLLAMYDKLIDFEKFILNPLVILLLFFLFDVVNEPVAVAIIVLYPFIILFLSGATTVLSYNSSSSWCLTSKLMNQRINIYISSINTILFL